MSITPADVCDFNEQVVELKSAGIFFCGQLERGDHPAPEFCEVISNFIDDDLDKFSEPGSMEREILYEFGKVSGATGNPIGKSKHARVIQVRLSLRSLLQTSSLPGWLMASCEPVGDREHRELVRQNALRQLAEIGRDYGRALVEIESDELEAECEALCRRIEGQARKQSGQPKTPRSKKEKVGDKALKLLNAEEWVAKLEDPIGWFVKELGCNRRELQPSRAPEFRKRLSELQQGELPRKGKKVEGRIEDVCA